MRATTKFIPGRLYADVNDLSQAEIMKFVKYQPKTKRALFEYAAGADRYLYDSDGLIPFYTSDPKFQLNKTESKQYE